MHEPTFRQALSHSWALVKQKKSLWIFGLLSAVIGQWGLSDFLGAFYRTAKNGFYLFGNQSFFEYATILNWHKVSLILLSLWLIGIILLVFFSLIFVAVGARGAIISYAIHYYKTGKILALHDAWNQGIKKFSSLLSVTLLGRFFQFIDLGIFSVLARLILNHDGLAWSFLLIITGAVSITIALLFEASMIYASGYILLENKSVKKSLQKGWQLLSDHLTVSLELGLVLVFLNVLFLGVAVYGSFVAFVPSLIVWIIAGLTGFNALIVFGMYSGMTLYVVIVLLAAGIFNAFVTCAWVYLFMKMHHEGVASRSIIFLKKFFRLS
ncbi:MAG: hypothetical protein HY979_03590 [Candidatus Magasanikbacteria bacterium]|nr:hypothetical protein [Candidatus Magasanikbacteria bacterium]